MGRAAKYSVDQLLDAARDMLVESGPAGVSVQAVAAATNAPSGSVYYRFASRDELLASLWLRSVERFQAGLMTVLAEPDAFVSARRAAAYVLEWSRECTADARVMLLFRSSDLLTAGWPVGLVDRNGAQRARVEGFFEELDRRLGAHGDGERRRVRFAVVDIPYAAARAALLRGAAPEAELDELVDTAVQAVLRPLKQTGKETDGSE